MISILAQCKHPKMAVVQRFHCLKLERVTAHLYHHQTFLHSILNSSFTLSTFLVFVGFLAGMQHSIQSPTGIYVFSLIFLRILKLTAKIQWPLKKLIKDLWNDQIHHFINRYWYKLYYNRRFCFEIRHLNFSNNDPISQHLSQPNIYLETGLVLSLYISLLKSI